MTDTRYRRREIDGEDEIDLTELLRIFWRKRLLIGLTALAFASAASITALIVPKWYTASALLSPAEGNSPGLGGASSAMAQYSGLASLVGISMPQNEKKQESIALLSSTLITEQFIRKYNLLPVLYGSRWDAARNRWRDGARVPTVWQGSEYLQRKIMNVADNAKTGLINLRITWKNPDVAATWATQLVELTNEYAQQKAIARASRDIAFLSQQAETTKYMEERQDVFTIMQGELTKEMLAEGTHEYALAVIDPAIAPEKPSFPRPVLWIVLALSAGLATGCLVTLIQYNMANSTLEENTDHRAARDALAAKDAAAASSSH